MPLPGIQLVRGSGQNGSPLDVNAPAPRGPGLNCQYTDDQYTYCQYTDHQPAI